MTMMDGTDMTDAELARWLTRLEGKIDKAINDHEARLRRVERFVYVTVGLSTAGAAGGLGSALATFGGG